MLNPSIKNNIKKIYVLEFFSMFAVLMPVIVPFFNSINIDMSGVFLLNSIFAFTVFIFEIPSGYISDILGRKKTLIISYFFHVIGFGIFPFSKGIDSMIIAEILLGISVSLESGTLTSLLYDSLEIIKSKKGSIKILGKSMFFAITGEAIASIIATILIYFAMGYKELATFTAIIAWIPFIITFLLEEPARDKMGASHKDNLKYIYKSMFKHSKLLNLIIVNSIFYFTGTLFAVWLFQKYWMSIEIPVIYFGILWATTNLTAAFFSKNAHKVEKKLGSANCLIFIGLLPISGYLGMSIIDHFIGFGACLLFQVCRGVGHVVLKDALNKRVSGDFRASANSIVQMGGRILYIIVGPVIGLFIKSEGVFFVSKWLFLLYIFVFIVFLIPLVKQKDSFLKFD